MLIAKRREATNSARVYIYLCGNSQSCSRIQSPVKVNARAMVHPGWHVF